MTYEEALKILTELKPIPVDGFKIIAEAYDLAIDAFEKRIAKKPRETRCQSCNHYIPAVVRDRKMRFCPFCGQKIDWSAD